MTPTDKTGLFLIILQLGGIVAWVVIKIVYAAKAEASQRGAEEDSEEDSEEV